MLATAVPSESIHLNHRLIGLSEEPGGVRLQFEREDEVLTGIVVGADGVNSTVRRYICGNVRPVYSGKIGFRGVIPTEKSPDLPTPTSLHIWCGPGTHAVLYGMDRGELVNFLAVYEPDQLPEWTKSSSRTAGTRDEALRIFENYLWDDRILDLVRHIEGDTNFWALVDLPRLPRWSRGRVVILGDAAHAPLPHQGQGAGQAIEDAYTIGSLLANRGSMITAPRSSPSSGSGDVARRGSRRIHVLREGPISLSATEQRDETRIGRRFRSESDGFITIARSGRCYL